MRGLGGVGFRGGLTGERSRGEGGGVSRRRGMGREWGLWRESLEGKAMGLLWRRVVEEDGGGGEGKEGVLKVERL